MQESLDMTKKKKPAPAKKKSVEREPKREFIGFDVSLADERLGKKAGVTALYQRWVHVQGDDGMRYSFPVIERGNFAPLRGFLPKLHRDVENELLLACELVGVGEEEP